MDNTSYGRAAMKLANTPGWTPYRAKVVDNGVLVTGAVCPLITRGVNKGQPNYRKMDGSTRQTIFVCEHEIHQQYLILKQEEKANALVA